MEDVGRRKENKDNQEPWNKGETEVKGEEGHSDLYVTSKILG